MATASSLRSASFAVLAALTLAACGHGSAKPPPHPGSSGDVVLGAKGFLNHIVQTGWGTARPRTIFGGGDPSIQITGIRWKGWGSDTAVGVGRATAFHLGKGGTYYKARVRAELRATKIGRCSKNGPRAYMDLKTRTPEKPGAPMGPWFDWAGSHGLCRYP